MAGQLQMEHQALLKAAREKLRGCHENQAFGETLQGVWAWLEEIQERLGTVDSTMGTKEQLEQRLETVQVRRDWLTYRQHLSFLYCPLIQISTTVYICPSEHKRELRA